MRGGARARVRSGGGASPVDAGEVGRRWDPCGGLGSGGPETRTGGEGERGEGEGCW